jgi:hypothetical protein
MMKVVTWSKRTTRKGYFKSGDFFIAPSARSLLMSLTPLREILNSVKEI